MIAHNFLIACEICEPRPSSLLPRTLSKLMATLSDPQREAARKILCYCGVPKPDILLKLISLGKLQPCSLNIQYNAHRDERPGYSYRSVAEQLTT